MIRTLLESVIYDDDEDDYVIKKYYKTLVESYCLKFIDNKIDYDTFIKLKDEELKDLGVEIWTHRKDVLKKTSALKSES